MTTLTTLGDRVRQARRAKGLSQAELATQAGIDRNTVLHLEKGDGNSRANVLLAVCDVLGLDLVLLDKRTAELEAADGASDLTQSQIESNRLMGTSRSTSRNR